MQIIIDATASQTMAYSGIGQYTKNIIEHLVLEHSGYNFHMLLYDGKTTLDSQLLDNSNVTITRIGKSPSPLLGLFTYWTKLLPALRQLSKSLDEPVYFSPYYRNGFPLEIMPTALVIHDFAMPKFNYFSDRGRFISAIRKIEFWFHMDRSEKCDAIITDSEFTTVDYMKYYPNYDSSNIHPILLGIELEEVDVDVDRYLPDDWTTKKYMLYMGGGIQKSKNTTGVVKSYARYLEKLEVDGVSKEEAPYLVIAGKIFLNRSVPESVKLHELIARLELKDKIHFSGFYEDNAKYSLIKNGILFIHLSLFEGFGIAVAEAMQVGTPVIAHKGTSYLEVVGDAGYLVDGTDYDEVSDTILKIAKGGSDIDGVIQSGQKKAAGYDWSKTATETAKVIAKIHTEFYGE